MAVSFGAVRGEFDPAWWGVNLLLVAWPCGFMRSVMGSEMPSAR